MTRSQFMYELMTCAEGFSDEEKYSLMSEYDGYFSEHEAQGESDEEIIAALPSPKEIADKFMNGEHVFSTEDKQNVENGATALGVMFFILLIPVLIVYEALVLALGLALALAILALCVAAAFGSVTCFGVFSLSGGLILAGVGGLFITVSLVLLSAAYFKGIGGAFKWFPSLMGRTLHFGKRGAA